MVWIHCGVHINDFNIQVQLIAVIVSLVKDTISEVSDKVTTSMVSKPTEQILQDPMPADILGEFSEDYFTSLTVDSFTVQDALAPQFSKYILQFLLFF